MGSFYQFRIVAENWLIFGVVAALLLDCLLADVPVITTTRPDPPQNITLKPALALRALTSPALLSPVA